MKQSKRRERISPVLRCGAALTLGVLVAACSNASGGGGGGPDAGQAATELRASGFGDHLGVQSVDHTSQTGEWMNLFYDPASEQALCLTGHPFQVSVRHGSSDQVLLYLQGGGACWDYQTCYVLKTATTDANGAIPIGALDTANPESPFKDFSIVYVPYCDGSVFTGDSTVDYSGNRTFHHGLWNLSVAVDALKASFPHPGRIVVSGSSAGGYGTFSGYGVTRVAFPDTEILVLNDSGPGLQNPDASQDVQDRVKNWNFTDRIPKSCTDCDTQYTFLLNWAFARDGGLRAAMYSYQQDSVISFFLDLNGPDYQKLLLDVTGEAHRRDPDRFERFFPQGTSHTVLQSDLFYTQQIDGETVRDWTQGFLDDSAEWRDLIQ
jgi:pectinacetylesterase